MNHAKGAAAALLLTAGLALAGCREATTDPTQAEPAGLAKVDTDVIDFAGTHGVRFGVTRSTLNSQGKLAKTEPSCAEYLVETRAAHLVFNRDQLVLMWAFPPLHTPEGVMVGTPVSKVRSLYPDAIALTPPPNTTTFPGLLVRNNQGDAYLILYDQDVVQKLVVGFEDAARAMYTTGFGTC